MAMRTTGGSALIGQGSTFQNGSPPARRQSQYSRRVWYTNQQQARINGHPRPTLIENPPMLQPIHHTNSQAALPGVL